MAKVKNADLSLIRGKLTKKSPVINRVRNGRQHSYIAEQPSVPPTKAQSDHRKLFGKVNSIVNTLMANPEQAALWEQRRKEFNSHQREIFSPVLYKTARQFAFAMVSKQLAPGNADKRPKKPLRQALPRGLKMLVKPFSGLSTTELYEILKARFIVFYTEQNCRYLDMDDIDYTATHIALFRQGQVIAYVRLFQGDSPEEWHLGRMLTIERGQGFGRRIVAQTEEYASSQGAKAVLLHAQTHAVPFYEKMGYTAYGPVFMEADIPHVAMRKEVMIDE